MGYNMRDYIKDFAERTKHNLDQIEKVAGIYYEVTMLVNSLFGLILLPGEFIKHNTYANEKNLTATKKINEYQFKDLESYKVFTKFIKKLKQEKRFKNTYSNKTDIDKFTDFIKHMRNSLAHSGKNCLSFLPCPENGVVEDIEEIIFYDELAQDTQGKKEQIFCLRLKIEEITNLAQILVNIYDEANENRFLVLDVKAYSDQVNGIVKEHVPGIKNNK